MGTEPLASDTLRARVGDVLGTVPDAMIVATPDGTIHLVNPATCAIFGYAEDELLGGPIERLMPDSIAAEHDGYVRRYMTTHEPRVIGTGRDVEGQRKSGEVFPARLAIGHFEHEGTQYFIGLLQDQTEARALRDQLLQAQRSEAVGQLTSGIAHDFNNLLTVLVSQIERLSLAAHNWPADDLDALDAMRRALGRATKITRQLLTIGRTAVADDATVTLAPAIESILPTLHSALGPAVTLRVYGSTALAGAVVGTTEARLTQLLLNLATNARDAMPNGGRVTLRLRSVASEDQQPARVVLEVEDTGEGIPADKVEQVFEPFFTTRSELGGSGLGLATVRAIVDDAGGSVAVRSTSGVGTTFTVSLPIVRHAEAQTSAPRPADPRSPSQGGLRVLVLDDLRDVLSAVAGLLRAYGCEVATAETVTEARASLLTRPFDVLLTDVALVGSNGADYALEVRRQHPALAIALMSGHAGDTLLSHAKAVHAVCTLQKPFGREGVEELLAACARHGDSVTEP